jgi:uncharacterized protein
MSQTSGSTGSSGSKDDRTMAMLAHILGIFTGFIGALIIWMIKKEDSPFVANNAKEALNFQITVMIGYVISFIAMFFLIGFVIWLVVWVCSLIFSIMGGMAASKGESYRYPVCIRLIN